MASCGEDVAELLPICPAGPRNALPVFSGRGSTPSTGRNAPAVRPWTSYQRRDFDDGIVWEGDHVVPPFVVAASISWRVIDHGREATGLGFLPHHIGRLVAKAPELLQFTLDDRSAPLERAFDGVSVRPQLASD